ncbi:MAG: hypothetical protein ACXABK_05870 [Candidatus Heimdallarchaeaceae archaeon]
MGIIDFFDRIERNDFLWLSAAFIVLFGSGFVIAFVVDPNIIWMIAIAAVIAGIYLIILILYIYANWHEWRTEKEILVELPSFPQVDFCDVCGKEMGEAEKKTDGEFLAIICPHCNAENLVSSEQKIQEVEQSVQEESEE